jgi:geranylgeranyl diphosphate synthase type II
MKDAIQHALLTYAETLFPSPLKDATLYAIRAGGKRFRPLITLTLLQSYGVSPERYVSVSIALEMIHMYSLIHDDLPAMDDDQLRHGIATLHLAFDEATAILVGDGLLADAFSMISDSQVLTPDQKINIVSLLSRKSGSRGMVYGQHLDLAAEGKTIALDALDTISHFKTGQLLEAAFVIAAVIARPQEQTMWSTIGLNLGLMFQIQDDVLEATTTVETLGKSKSDVVLKKATFVTHLGMDKAKEKIEKLYHDVLTLVKQTSIENDAIIRLIQQVKQRQY